VDFAFSDEQNELRELARKILGDIATNERLKDIEAQETVFDEELWRELGRANLLGIAIEEEHGGLGFGYSELCLLMQEIGRAVAPVPVHATLVLGALPISEFGTAAQKSEWLPRIATGDAILSAALVETAAGCPSEVLTRATADGSGWKLDGVKSLVPAAQLANRVLVPAATDKGIGLFLVDPKADGVSLEMLKTSDRQAYCEMALEGVTVAAEGRLGDDGNGAAILEWLVNRSAMALCATHLGVGERALEMTAEYGRERIQFDRPIGSFQAFHQRAADAYIHMEGIRLTVLEGAQILAAGATGAEAANAVSVAKYCAAEGGQFTTYACTHLHGGIGIDIDYPLHRYFIWSTQLEHTLGCARDHLARLGARIRESGIPARA
jgi:alkylation response protein AidB-like acyl-CoA dehydrogenase